LHGNKPGFATARLIEIKMPKFAPGKGAIVQCDPPPRFSMKCLEIARTIAAFRAALGRIRGRTTHFAAMH
jgi:hypothetical protein